MFQLKLLWQMIDAFKEKFMNPNFAGIASILMWSLLAYFVASSGNVPPFLLLGLTFVIATCVGLVRFLFKRPDFSKLKIPLVGWVVGIGGLFGYHYFYYVALQNAPVAEANIINYLWPLFIVLGSSFLPGEKLRLAHIIGALFGFAGAALLVGKGLFSDNIAVVGAGQNELYPNIAYGYFAAILCSLIWSSYSVLSRALKKISTDAVVFYCFATAVLAFIAHGISEETIWPQGILQWGAVLGMGLMPVGGAFYTWDYAMKNGNIQLLGSLCYFIPVLSTLILVTTGVAPMSWHLGAATVLVTFGAIIASQKKF